jgi:hypothetical protein
MELSPVFGQIFGDDAPLTFLTGLVKFFSASISFLLLAALVGGLVYLIHFFFTLPMRREERARLFLDLVEGALNRGQSIEEMILSVCVFTFSPRTSKATCLLARHSKMFRDSCRRKLPPCFVPGRNLAT